MKTLPTKTLITATLAALALSAWADHHGGGPGHEHKNPSKQHATADAAMEPTLTEGEVRAISKERQRITLKHGEIKNLNMAAMTMAFAVKDPAMLDQVKVGDKVEFKAVKDKGPATLIELRVKP